MSRIFIGVDVSKDQLDATVRPNNESRRFANDPAGIDALVEWVKSFSPERIVFESTGHYQKKAVGALLAAALPVRRGQRSTGPRLREGYRSFRQDRRH